MLDALRFRDFRLLWFGSLFSYSAHWINQVSIGWVAYELTGSGTFVGVILGARAIPILLLAPFAGVAADRYSRRNLLIVAGATYAVATGALGALLASGVARPWHLFAFTIGIGIAHTFDRTTRQSAIQDVVPREAVMNAVALNTVAFSLMRVVSPALAGYLIVWFGAPGNFLSQSLLYALAVATLSLTVFPPPHHIGRAASMWQSLAEGVRFSMRHETTRLILLFTALPFLFLIPVWSTLMPLYAKDVFQAGPEGLGWLVTATGSGGLLGAVAATALSRFDRLGWLQIATTALFAVAVIGVAASPSIAIAIPLVLLAGIGEMVSVTAGQTMLQMSAPAAMRGRILGLLGYNPALISLGSVIIGIGADALGTRAVTATVGLVALAITAALAVRSPRLRALRLSRLGDRSTRATEDHRAS